MQLIGFVLLCIGVMIFFFARRIVKGKTKLLSEEDEKEFCLLTSGAVIAVKIAAVVVAIIGLAFLALGNAIYSLK